MPIATTIRLNTADRVLCVEFDDGTRLVASRVSSRRKPQR